MALYQILGKVPELQRVSSKAKALRGMDKSL